MGFFVCFQRNPRNNNQWLLVTLLSFASAGLLGYLLGSIPTAYLFVRWKSNLDIRKAGSGNVGTLNSYEVTRSKAVGVAVLLLDILKGILAVMLARTFIGGDFWIAGLAGLGVTIGHNYPVWLGFRGGRGLASAAGVMFAIGWPLVVVWGAIWVAGFKLSRDVNIGNATACLLTLGFTLVVPADILMMILTMEAAAGSFRVFALFLFAILLLRLIEPVRDFVQQKKSLQSK